MKSNFSIVVWMMVISVLMKMIIFSMNWQFGDYEKLAIFGNVFVLMTGVFLGIRLFKINHKGTSFAAEFKAGMKIAAMYAIAMTAFVYLYYSIIDASYFDQKLENQIELATEHNEVTEDPEQQIDLKQVRETGAVVLSPFFQSTVTLLGFLLLGSFYSGMLTFLMRKFPGFRNP